MTTLPFLLILLLSSVVLLTSNLDLNHIVAFSISLILALFLPQGLSRLRKNNSWPKLGSNLIGILVGIFLAMSIQRELSLSLWLFWPITVFISLILGYSFQEVFYNEKEVKIPPETATLPQKNVPKSRPKILDTSVIIDGRIVDIVETGFVEGPFVVPNFVLREIQLISDSPEGVKRSRGRRGLDILNQLQKKKEPEVTISYNDYPELRDVDSKLIKLTKDLGGVLVTNDYNLNKVAEIEGIRVLNINNLAMALKPVVLPGEDLEIQILREGKDENQGIGYLEDGTMVVVESGGKLIGKKVKVLVNSVLQTNAGKMIFTKIAGT